VSTGHTLILAIVSNALAAMLGVYSMVGPPELAKPDHEQIKVMGCQLYEHNGGYYPRSLSCMEDRRGWQIIYGGDAYYGKTKAEQGMD
jgi:hypothetical protein